MEFDLAELQRNLSRRGFGTHVCENRREALSVVMKMIIGNEGGVQAVGIGNSDTLRAIALKEALAGLVPDIFIHSPGCQPDEDRKALLADIYFTSANAVSSDGQIVNIDGTGNRTSATCFGPKHVVFIIGRNKITRTLNDAIARAKNVAAVELAKRYARRTPCAVTGKCEDCLSDDCICGVMTIHRKWLFGNKISVILVDEYLGV